MSTEITNNYIEEYTTQEKLQILADAAKYDVACTSSGSDRRGKKGELGNAAACGHLPQLCVGWQVYLSA
ncbi:MAG: hypothetical protein ACLUGQ_13255 [Coprococcus sp.]